MSERIRTLKVRYPNQWLAIKVTKRGPHHEPLIGELLARAPTHRALHRRLKDPNVYETYTGRIPRQAILF